MAENAISKKVRIKRASSFLTRAQGKEIDEYYEGASKSIGSFWESSSNKRIGSGLTMLEEHVLLPLLFGVPKEDREFLKLRNEYFAALEVKVPAKDGIELEIGLSSNITKPVSLENLPISIDDYIRYRFAKAHPWTATSQEEAEGNQLKHFYIHDDVLATDNQANANELKDQALGAYLAVKSNPEKVKMMLTLLGTDYRDLVGQTEAQAVQLRSDALRKLADLNAKDFVKFYEDKDFEVKYTLKMLLNTGILKQVGSKILVVETGKSLGTQEEAEQFFKDETENSDHISMLKAKLQEAVKTNKRSKRTATVLK